MALRLYNTLNRKKEAFKPVNGKRVGFYSCGPTVYNFAHVGNFRAYVFGDLLKRYLRYKGFGVRHVMNLTDVDDKTIRDSQKEGVSLKAFTERYSKFFFEDVETLNILKADVFPKATEHIKEMIALIETLLEKGFAYRAKDGVYFAVSKVKGYGKLAHLDLKGLKSGARVKQDEYDKENVQDFVLWKFWDKNDGDVFWETSLGRGRPGWHIECSAMSMKYLGSHFDIHTGGVDLIFPHHENEIAQSEAATGEKFVNYWLHNEHLLVDGKKMSKSAGNFLTLRDILSRGCKPMAIRYLLLSTHYRQQLNFTFAGLESAQNAVDKLDEFVRSMKSVGRAGKCSGRVDGLIKKAGAGFEDAMDDDLNVSSALAAVFDFMKKVNKIADKLNIDDAKKIVGFIDGFNSVFGVIAAEDAEVPSDVMELVKKREDARKKKDFMLSDLLRGRIKEKGFAVDDSADGPVVKKL